MNYLHAPDSYPAPAPADNANGNHVSADTTHLLRRLCSGDRIARFFRTVCDGKDVYVSITAADGSLLLTYGAGKPTAPYQDAASASVMYREHSVATVLTCVRTGSAQEMADWVAIYLAELLELEADVASLASEVVHSYEELHLLYSLGEALGGVLDMKTTCNLIVQSIVTPLNAVKATLYLREDDDTVMLATATNPAVTNPAVTTPDAPAEIRNPQARTAATLQVNAAPIGEIVLEGKLDAAEFSSGDGKLLEGVAAVAAPAIHNVQLYQVARHQADTDGLTGLLNHRCLQERLDHTMEDARQNGEPMTIILADLDNFKLFNDVYGHPVGDRVLQAVSLSLKEVIRATDFVGRYGGDEFILVLPQTDAAGAMKMAQSVVQHVKDCDIKVNGASLPLRVSVGTATFPTDATSKHELIAHADTALYEAKASGGGRIMQAHAPAEDWKALQTSSYSALEGLVKSVDAKDHYTRSHSEIVTDAALLLAEALHLSDESQRALRIAGLLHDIGKIGIPDRILKKPGTLTSEEYAIMQQHVQLSEMMIKNVPHINDVLAAVAHHHERYDGRGYPYRKQGERIPLLGRIMAVADAYSAMSLDRPYRKHMDWEEIRKELERGAGTQFDPDLVRAFIQVMEEAGTGRHRKPVFKGGRRPPPETESTRKPQEEQ